MLNMNKDKQTMLEALENLRDIFFKVLYIPQIVEWLNNRLTNTKCKLLKKLLNIKSIDILD